MKTVFITNKCSSCDYMNLYNLDEASVINVMETASSSKTRGEFIENLFKSIPAKSSCFIEIGGLTPEYQELLMTVVRTACRLKSCTVEKLTCNDTDLSWIFALDRATEALAHTSTGAENPDKAIHVMVNGIQ